MVKKSVSKNKIKIKLSRKTVFISLVVVFLLTLLFVFKGFFVAALVNGRPVCRLSVINELEKQGGKNILDGIVTKTLIYQEAGKKKIKVESKEIESEIKKLETNLATQGLTLDLALSQANMKKADLDKEIKLQLMIKELVGEVKVTAKEVDDYMSNQAKNQTEDQSSALTKTQVEEALKNQKLQAKIQELVPRLQSEAKIGYFVKY